MEVKRGKEGIRNPIEILNTMAGRGIPMGLNPASSHRLVFTTREPIGVAVAISAFNYPFNLIVHQVSPAVATGCPVIIKPAQTTPLSCQNLVEALYEAGLPKQLCQMVLLDNEGAEALATDPRIDFSLSSDHLEWVGICDPSSLQERAVLSSMAGRPR